MNNLMKNLSNKYFFKSYSINCCRDTSYAPKTSTNLKSAFKNVIKRTLKRNKQLIKLSLCALLLMYADDALAGTGGSEFNEVWETLKGWIQGILGRIICGIMILVGIIAGVARQSLTAFALGIGGAIGLYNVPAVLESVLSATVDSYDIQEILSVISQQMP